MHNNNGTEKIIGFDNVKLTAKQTDAIETITYPMPHRRLFDLQGRPVDELSAAKGLYIREGRKLIK